MNVADLFPEPRTDASRRLKELAARHDELRVEARDLGAKATADSTARVELTAQLHAAQARAHAFGSDAAEVKVAEQKLSKLEKVAVQRAEESRIVSDAAATVAGELKRHAAEHAKELWRELTKDNTGVAERLTKAVETMTEAVADYTQAGARATELMRLIDVEQLRVTRVPEAPGEVVQLAKAAKVAAPSIRVPVPERPGQGPAVHLAEQPKAISA